MRDGVTSGIHGCVRAGVSIGGAIVKPLARVVAAYLPQKVTELGVGHRAIGMFGGRAAVRGGELPAAMTVRLGHRRVVLERAALAEAFPSASGRVVVFLHGLVETERSWFHEPDPDKARTGTDFGGRLAEDYDCSAVHVRYNTGRHISDNGHELVGLLSALVARWPTENVPWPGPRCCSAGTRPRAPLAQLLALRSDGGSPAAPRTSSGSVA